MKYINTTRDKNQSEYARVEPTFDGSLLTFNVKKTSPTLSGVKVDAVNGYVRIVTPIQVDVCGTDCKPKFNQSVEIKFNVVAGADYATLLTEATRVLNKAQADYSLTYGVVPPATATFSDE